MKKYWSAICLGIILLIGLVLRVYNLSSLPHGFFADEAGIGYNAFTLLYHGTDEYGKVLPIFFQSFGDYKTPVEIYSTIPSILLFGLNEFSVRIVSAFYGLLAVLLMYFLTKELLAGERYKITIALFATLLLAISPWEIHMSRISMEGIMPFVFFVVLGAYLFFKSKTHPKMFVVSVLSFSLGMYTYFPSRLFIPLFFLLLLSLFPKSVPFKRLSLMILAISIMVIFSLPFIASIADGTFSARINQVSIFSDPPKNETVLSHITTNYFRHFSMDFLFTKGDIDMPGQFITRQSIRGMGELYLFELPLILLGFVYLFYKQKKIGLFLLFWLLLYPTGSMFTTNESPYATRSIIGVIPLTLLSGVGLRYLFALIKRMGKFVYYPAVAVVCAVIVVSFFWFAHLYFQEYPLYSSDFWGWQYGAGPVVKYFVTHQKEYDDLALAGDFNAPEIFLKFYAPNGECSKCKISSPADIYDPTRKQLFAMTDDDINRARQFSYTTKDIIYYPDGKEAFRLVEVEKR